MMRRTQPGVARVVTLDAIVLAVGMLPLFLTAHLPLVDLPNHLARQVILRDIWTSPILQQYYAIDLHLTPNLALDLFVGVARHFVSIDASMRLFCVATLAALFFGTRAAAIALGTAGSRLYLGSPLFFYGGPFQYGFLSFCFGIGLSLCLFALHVRTSRGPTSHSVIAFGGFLLLLCHIAAFGVFAVAVAGWELGRLFDRGPQGIGWPGWRETASTLTVMAYRLALPLLVFVLLSTSQDVNVGVRWANFYEIAEAVLAITSFAYPYLELGMLAVALASIGSALALKAITIPRRCLPMICALALLTLMLPRSGFGGGFIDYRVPWSAAFYLLASLGPGLRAGVFARPLTATWAVLVFARVASVAVLWLSSEPILARIDAALSTLPAGARLMVAEGRPASTAEARRPPLTHMAAYAVARRQAFEPMMFAGLAGHILKFQPPFRSLTALFWQTSSPHDHIDELVPEYDHLLVLRPGLVAISPGLSREGLSLVLLAAGPDFALFRIVR